MNALLSTKKRRLSVRILRASLLALLTFSTSCKSLRRGAREDLDAVRAVLQEQVKAWNRGDLEAFAHTYERSRNLVFRGPDELSTGWDAMLVRYRRGYPDRKSMGTLRFANLELDDLGYKTILAHGRWELVRENDAPMGHFAIVLRQLAEGWRIVLDYSNRDGDEERGATAQ